MSRLSELILLLIVSMDYEILNYELDRLPVR